jgi:hypothetical protein
MTTVTLTQEDFKKLLGNGTEKMFIQGGSFNWKNLIIWIIILLLLNAVLWYYSYYIKPKSGLHQGSASSLFSI